MKNPLVFISCIWIILSCSDQKEVMSTHAPLEDSLFIIDNYSKKEVLIPMRDGTNLFTTIYSPIGSGQHPILLHRSNQPTTPYGRAMASKIGPSSEVMREGYIIVYQEVRGMGKSQGDYKILNPPAEGKTGQPDESTDTFDTIDWLIQNLSKSNGKVGLWGEGLAGYFVLAGLVNQHPAIAAAYPQSPVVELYDLFYENGAFLLGNTFELLADSGFVYPEEGYQFFLKNLPISNLDSFISDTSSVWYRIKQHPTYDQFWKSGNILPHLEEVNCAVLNTGGWYESNGRKAREVYNKIESYNPAIENRLVIGPWSKVSTGSLEEFHGDIHFGSDPKEYFHKQILLPFFNHHLKGYEQQKKTEVEVFQTGVNRWREFESWPPKNTLVGNLFLHPKNVFSFRAPSDNQFGMDEFRSNPLDPIPYFEESTLTIDEAYKTSDQSSLIGRKDLLYYQTDALEEPVTLVGSPTAHIEYWTDQSDADIVVKLIDVYPEDHPPSPHQPNRSLGHYHQLVSSVVVRGKYRNSTTLAEPFEPRKITRINISLQDIHHTFKPGHRIMLMIHSTWFPLFDINPQRFSESHFSIPTSEFTNSRNRIFRSGIQPSYLTVRMSQVID